MCGRSAAAPSLEVVRLALLNLSCRLNYDPNDILVQQRFPVIHRKHYVVML